MIKLKFISPMTLTNDKRFEAMKWWEGLLHDERVKQMANNGFVNRYPHTLTGREIENIWRSVIKEVLENVRFIQIVRIK